MPFGYKYLLQYHIIFLCKYRKKLLIPKQISDDIKQLSHEICQKHNVIIKYMETDKDHIHYMIETLRSIPCGEPTMSILKIVNLIKSYTTYHIWERYPDYLRKHFWKEQTFWTDGYFACSVGCCVPAAHVKHRPEQSGDCFRRNAEKIHRKPRIERRWR